VLSLAGLGVSTYLTVGHYSAGVTLACPATATINCQRVTTSSWSELAGLPVAVVGDLFFIAMTASFLPMLARLEWMDRARAGASVIGAGFVLYLVWAELFRIDAICLWCSAVHVVTLGLLATTIWSATAPPADA
jgi:uncharacterized membrane protein